MAEKCKECGCECTCCTQDDQENCDMHLHVEIENLRQRLLERDNHIVTMETQFLNEADKFPNGELASIKEEILIWQEKYSRLYEAHKRVQKVNQNLEDKLLRIVDKCETEKGAFTKDIATLSHRLADANYTIHRLTQDNEKYRNDVNLAIQLLQCKPSNFVGQKYDSLPSEVQAKVRTYVAQKRRSSDTSPPDVKSITVPISTFPPTAMVYNVTKPNADKHSDDDTDEAKPPVDIVSAAIMAKVLEDREKERIFGKHCDTCTCHKSILMVDAETQTNTYTSASCNECTSRDASNFDRYTDSHKGGDKGSHNKDNQNFKVHTVYQEINENISNVKMQYYNNSNAKHSNSQSLCVKDKTVVRNSKSSDASREDNRMNVGIKTGLNKKNSVRRNDLPIQTISSSYSSSSSGNVSKQNTFQNHGDISMSKLNSDKTKQSRCNKKSDPHIDAKSNTNYWNKFERRYSFNNNTMPENSTTKERSQIDIINDRLWKNEWTKLRTELSTEENKKRYTNSDAEIDVINDRVWKNNKSWSEAKNPTHLTLIEVKNIDSATTESDSKQTEIATSPSYSSDSVVISTSDPSSSSSDVIQSQTSLLSMHNGTNSKSSTQNRITGPRNCLVRVTPGSKNILLDNIGQYKTVMYTSGSNKSNTALVHIKKTSRSDSERSISTSSDDNSPVLLHNENQLQRVAEWVQSSVRMDKSEQGDGKALKHSGNVVDKQRGSSVSYDKSKSFHVTDNESEEIRCEQSLDGMVDFSKKKNNDPSTPSFLSDTHCDTLDKEKDLITFDVPSEDENPQSNNKTNNAEFNYEVKITKEMEETYLKLAASLDPAALNLPSSESMDLTIEKYRKDYKRLHAQRVQEKASSTT